MAYLKRIADQNCMIFKEKKITKKHEGLLKNTDQYRKKL